MTSLLKCLALASLVAVRPTHSLPPGEPQRSSVERPRLVLVISIDQYRADYLSRFADLYLPPKTPSGVGGFRYLAELGATYSDAHQGHYPTSTGPGHAAILTGTGPDLNGIVGNSWFSRETGKSVYCVDDPQVQTVGGPSSPMSPRNLKVSTVGDELEMATNGASKVVSIALKDRASILMGGHAADAAVWFDGAAAGWVTSTWYGSKLPSWAQEMNDRKIPAAEASRKWTPVLSDEQLRRSRPVPSAKGGVRFEHPLGGENAQSSVNRWYGSPFAQQFVCDTARAAIESESLGADDTPDLLAIGFSTNDSVGHTYGPNSPEVLDLSVRTDRMLSDLLNFIDKKVGLDRTAIVLTADHGVLPIVEEARDGYRQGHLLRPRPQDVTSAIEDALDAAFGQAKWVSANIVYGVYLDRTQIVGSKADPAAVEAVAARAAMSVPGVHYVFTRSDILSGRVPQWPWARTIARSYNPHLCGDILPVFAPGAYPSASAGTGHGAPWAYDTHVPLIFAGYRIKPGVYARRVEVTQIASTLSQILGTEYPTGNVGEPLYEVVAR